ncbi:endolytic transglycosylase MltG [Pontimonas sp.]|uniref:endolytic transglycosylase MltG n=1 Tax=Pontimonas sp. TaxID=2304492 RepID=UPI00286FC85D|nr:endolytic transglycosylase MltG [Pontimonas sp.]MDR9434013.1 endolytic transglycosylase MltG [Pontimonas sp.]
MSDDEFEALLRGSSQPDDEPDQPEQRSRRDRRESGRSAGALILIIVLVVIAGIAGSGWWAWGQYGDRVLAYLGEEEIPDYAGEGSSDEVLIVVEQGDIGEDVARKLADQGVTASFESVYQLLLEDTSVTFQPGTYRLRSEMSGSAAIDALQDSDNRLLYRITIPEGRSVTQAIETIAENSDIPLADLEAAIADPSVYGVTPPAENTYLQPLEGYLFPATYEVEPGTSASALIQEMVDEMLTRLDDRGVPAEQRHEVLTKAALVQREAKEPEDFFKVAAVIDNRLEDGMALQFDSTVTYWENTYGTVWTTDEGRANADNPYNTYYYTGLPVGPIGLPGDIALDAVLEPAEGDWKYFVTVNLQSGETKFSNTLAEHDGAVALLREWCDNIDNAVYCE